MRVFVAGNCPWLDFLVATDESLALIVEKRRLAERLPAYEVSGGLNQIELRLAVMHNEMVIQRGMAVEKLVYLLATAPATIFGLYPRKGTIAIGSDADLVLFDPKIRKQIRNKISTKARITRYLKAGRSKGFRR